MDDGAPQAGFRLPLCPWPADPAHHLFLVPTFRGDVLDRVFSALETFQESPPSLAWLGEPEQMKEALETLRIGADGRP